MLQLGLGSLAVLAAVGSTTGDVAQSFFGLYTFDQAEVPIAPGARHLRLVDLNGDGELDLALTFPDADEVHLYAGDGAGGFALWAQLPVGPTPVDVEAADLDEDGDVDLVFQHGKLDTYAGFTVVAGLGGGSFAPPVHYATAGPVRDLALGEFDSRPGLDLVVGMKWGASLHAGIPPGPSPSAPSGLAPGEGLFAPGVPLIDGIALATVNPVDLNGDGALDVAVGQYFDFGLYSLLGDGHGGFQEVYDQAWTAAPTHVQFADFEGDGILDAVGSTADFELALESQRGWGSGRFKLIDILSFTYSTWFRIADFDLDGSMELVYPTLNSTGVKDLMFVPELSIATYSSPMQFLDLPDGAPLDGEVADLNGDGSPDIVLLRPSAGELSVLINTTPPHTDHPIHPTLPVPSSPVPSNLVPSSLVPSSP